MAIQPTNLYEYYTSKGLTLPKVEALAPIYESYGLGSAIFNKIKTTNLCL